MWAPLTEEARSRVNEQRARFDLLRLRTARRLRALEKGVSLTDPSLLVPEYLEALPVDRFSESGASYRFAGDFYSIGNDRIDDGGAIVYDPTNGAPSKGDIFLRDPNADEM